MSQDNSDSVLACDQLAERKAVLAMGLGFLGFLLLLSVAWRFSPFKEGIDAETVVAWQEFFQEQPAALFWVIGTYIVGNVVSFPVTILNVATVAVFGPVLGNAYGFAGWLCSASLGFVAGRALGRRWVQKAAPAGLQRLLYLAGRHGFLTALSVRIVPIAPFTVINLALGASGIRFAEFFLATVVGRIPGLVMLVLFGLQLENFLRRPGAGSLVLLALAILLIPVAGILVRKVASPRIPPP